MIGVQVVDFFPRPEPYVTYWNGRICSLLLLVGGCSFLKYSSVRLLGRRAYYQKWFGEWRALTIMGRSRLELEARAGGMHSAVNQTACVTAEWSEPY